MGAIDGVEIFPQKHFHFNLFTLVGSIVSSNGHYRHTQKWQIHIKSNQNNTIELL